MKFIVFQCSESPDYILVTDKDHVDDVEGRLRPEGGDLRRHSNGHRKLCRTRRAFRRRAGCVSKNPSV